MRLRQPLFSTTSCKERGAGKDQPTQKPPSIHCSSRDPTHPPSLKPPLPTSWAGEKKSPQGMELQAGVILFMTKNGEFSPSCPQPTAQCGRVGKALPTAQGPGAAGARHRVVTSAVCTHPSQADDPSGLCFLVKYRKGWTKRALPAQTRMTPRAMLRSATSSKGLKWLLNQRGPAIATLGAGGVWPGGQGGTAHLLSWLAEVKNLSSGHIPLWPKMQLQGKPTELAPWGLYLNWEAASLQADFPGLLNQGGRLGWVSCFPF